VTASRLRASIVTERSAWIRRMLAEARALPLDSVETFRADPRNVAAADSYVRRALEALLDLGRHVLARGFGRAVVEYKEIPKALVEVEVLDRSHGEILRLLAGYRNRLVHFYHEIGEEELYEICRGQLGDIEKILTAFMTWLDRHPEKLDRTL
jgi:uncharacterized protein YutE (UPF0331/DUF86 family)